MQLCPCIRLRLWRQYGRGWQTQWANLTTAATTPTATATAPAAAAGQNHRRNDKAYWGGLWDAAADAVADGAAENGPQAKPYENIPVIRYHRPQPTAKARQYARRQKSLPQDEEVRRTGKTVRRALARDAPKLKQPPRVFLGQLGHLQRTSPPGKAFMHENANFWRWKQALAVTWELLEAGKLPQPEAATHMLRDLLAAGTAPDTTEPDADPDAPPADRIAKMRAAWRTRPDTEQRTAWPDMMIAALRSHPADAPAVFQATFDASLVPSYLAEDTLYHMIRQHVTPPAAVKGVSFTTSDELLSALRTVLENSPGGYLRLLQAALYLYSRSQTTPAGVAQLYHMLVAYKHPMHENTRLQMASRLAADPAHKIQAIYVLQAMLQTTGLDINTPKGAALCTTILQRGTGPALPDTPTPAEMFEQLLRCGLEPNLITYTTILRDLCLARELDAAQQVLQLMIDKNQIEPDDYVYSTMLNGAKLCGNFGLLRQVAASAAAQGVRHPFVWNDFLQALYATAFAEARQTPTTAKRPRVVPAFPLMLQAYTRLFAAGPLRTILPGVRGALAIADDEQASSASAASSQLPVLLPNWDFSVQMAHTVHALPLLPAADKVQPDGATLATMVIGYLQGLSNPYDIIAFYSHFRRLLQEGDAVATAMVREQGTQVHDAVVFALCDHESMLRVALDVLGDMLAAASAGTHAPPPSVYTWSILLNAFMFHRQTVQGERILHMMRERGIPPSLVTWNTLVAGYARLQNARKTAGALQRLERAGFVPDDWTLRAFSYLHNKGGALQYLEARGRAHAEREAAERAGYVFTDAPTPHGARNRTRPPPSPPPLRSPASPVLGGAPATADASELRELANEVEQISRMMDDEAAGR